MMTTKQIGPTFGAEIAAANLSDIPFCWKDGVLYFNEDVSAEKRAAVQAVLDAHDPTKQLVPQSVTRYQARAALLDADLLQQVNDHFSALPDDTMGKLAWLEAPTVERTSPWLIEAAHALGLSDDMIDQLFIAAAAVK